MSPRAAWRAVLAVLLVSQSVVATVLATTRADRPAPWPISVAVVGDSLTAGGLNRVVWPTLLAQRTGWSVANFALPDAGFVADGRGGHAFTYQVDRAQAMHPRVVLFMTGDADNGLPEMDAVRIGALDAINKVITGGERALVVGPTWYQSPVPEQVRRVSAAVSQAATEAGVPFLDALDPPWLTPELMHPDASGPTDAGQSVIADRVAAWLRTEVPR
jgi:GDSL-like Lipase/Acylhydrolase family